MENQNIKEILKEQREEYQRFMGVALDNIDTQIKLVSESLDGTREHLGAIREMVAKNTEDIQSLAMDMHIVRSDLKEKVGRDEFAALEQKIV